jgi:hypothetical protein
MASPQVRASAVRQLTSTARELVSQAKTLVEQSEAAPAGSPEKTSLEEQARESLAKARSIAESANKLAQ